MANKQHNTLNNSSDNTPNREKSCSFKINEGLFKRMETHVKSQYSKVRSKTDLIETAILEFLDREEPIADKIKELRCQLEKRA